MPNHYHLLIQTPFGNISRVMRHIDGVYTQWYNKFHCRDGSLFRGRYKSLLVEEDAYLVELLRYIHLNPVKGLLVKAAEDHPWTSHRAYMCSSKNWDWLTCDRLMAYFGNTRKTARKNLTLFLQKGVPEDLSKVLSAKRWPSVLSTKNFEDWVAWNFVKDLTDREIQYKLPKTKKLSEEKIRRIITDCLETQWDKIRTPQGYSEKQNRALALALYAQELNLSQKEMQKCFKGILPSTMARAFKRGPLCEILKNGST